MALIVHHFLLNNDKSSSTGFIENTNIKLFQNKPNPFNRNTIVEYNIPVDFKSANVYIYNLQGNQVKKYNINEKGKNSIEIQASELKPGIYIYALIVDGAEIDNKRMILTD